MIIAAFVFSLISMLVSLALGVWMLAKHLSTHQIQMVPVESFLPNGKQPEPIGHEFEEFDTLPPMPLTEEEKREAKLRGLVK